MIRGYKLNSVVPVSVSSVSKSEKRFYYLTDRKPFILLAILRLSVRSELLYRKKTRRKNRLFVLRESFCRQNNPLLTEGGKRASKTRGFGLVRR